MLAKTYRHQRFYELWRLEKLEPSEALRRAQQWIRDTNNGKKVVYFQALLHHQSEYDLDKTIVDRLYKFLVLANPIEYDFKRPFHWAAFSYVGI